MRPFIALLLLATLVSCTTRQEEVPFRQGLTASEAMVVSARKEASEIGLGILEQGGNAFDAMIATQLALAVVHPNAGNLGGGGFMVFRTAYGEYGSLDFRETAPLKAGRDMYLDENGEYRPECSKDGALAVGVPGTVAGLFAVHEKLGSLPLEAIVQPVIELAQKGFRVTAKQAARLARYRNQIAEINGEASLFTQGYREGDMIANPALARTLQILVAEGYGAFYGGQLGETMIAYLQEHGGIITRDDLLAYEVKWREPLRYTYKDLDIIAVPPPSSGGICLGQILGMIEAYPLSTWGHNSLNTIQLLVEAERRAFADRSHYLGDPDFVAIPVDSLLSASYLRDRMASFDPDSAGSSAVIGPGTIPGYESEETTHFSIVDSLGNAVAVTTTLNGSYGSRLYVPQLGFFLNNEMDDFSAKPGEPNMFGLVGGAANEIAPQKRMLSSMTPTIVEKDGQLFMVLGSPGGSTIITSVLQTLLNVYEFGMGMQEAVDAPRFHHQWLPDSIRIEQNGFSPSLLRSLGKRGYNYYSPSPTMGRVDAILLSPDGLLEAGADPRGDDAAAGY